MADEPVAENLDEQPEEEEGGPVKSFLEHLEDLRWVLIKSCAAAGVAMHISCNVLRPKSLESGPARMTKVSPSSLRQNTLPPYAHGDAVNAVAPGSILRGS